MSSQLAPARTGKWECPVCGRTAKVPAHATTIHCDCGSVILDGVAIKTSAAARRVLVCRECKHWMENDRCEQIELGCRAEFKAALAAGDTGCPLGKWRVVRARRAFFWPSVHVLNLLYHVCPLQKNDVWRANVRQVVRRLRIFNGRKVVAVVTGDGLHGVDVVRQAFGDPTIEYLEIPNDPELREVATFLPLLEAVESADPEEASFYAHTKGNSTKDNALGAEMWRNEMYHSLLDGVHVCRDLLLTHPCVGTHKMHYPVGMMPYPSKLNHGTWLFAGTFFWFRHDAVYGHPQWRIIPQDRYGAEAWLSGLFAPNEGASIFQPWPASEYPPPSPYDPALYLWPIRDC